MPAREIRYQIENNSSGEIGEVPDFSKKWLYRAFAGINYVYHKRFALTGFLSAFYCIEWY